MIASSYEEPRAGREDNNAGNDQLFIANRYIVSERQGVRTDGETVEIDTRSPTDSLGVRRVWWRRSCFVYAQALTERRRPVSFLETRSSLRQGPPGKSKQLELKAGVDRAE
jgi:hypothetical protein